MKRPKISVKLKAYKDHGDFIQLVLCNVGQGAAFNVDFHLEDDEGILGNHGVLWRGTVAPINFMASGETEIYEMGSKDTLFADPVMLPFPVDITYMDVDGIVYQEKIMLDVTQFKLLQWRGASVAWRQMKALEDIAKLLQAR